MRERERERGWKGIGEREGGGREKVRRNKEKEEFLGRMREIYNL